MKRGLAFSVVLWVGAVLTLPGFADIIVLNNGQVFVGKVSAAASGRLKLTTDYGDQFFARSQVASFYLTPQGMEAEGYYQAGVLLFSKGKRDAARQLFERCVKYDAGYRNKCIAALKGAPSGVPPTAPVAAGAPAAVSPTAAAAKPQVQVVKIQCPECSGTGVVMSSSSLREGGSERPRPCPICGGKGFRTLRIPPGYEICSECGGFGASSGGGSSDKSTFTLKKEMCPRCAGRGVVKKPWTPPEQTGVMTTPGAGAPSMTMSPAPGAAPPHGAMAMARDRAKTVASGGQPTRPVGPAAVRPVSPTFVEDTPPAGDSGDEIIQEDEGATSEAVTEKGGEESESQDKEEKSASVTEYRQPGISGWVGRNKLYVILGGVALMVFAVVFNKMSAKK